MDEEDNGDGLCRLPRRRGLGPRLGHDEVNAETNELGREVGKAFDSSARIPIFDDDVLPLDSAEIAQALPEGF